MNTEELAKLTPAQMRIKIAETYGYSRKWEGVSPMWVARDPHGCVMYCDPDPSAEWETHKLPDYFNDLNAIREAVAKAYADEPNINPPAYVAALFHQVTGHLTGTAVSIRIVARLVQATPADRAFAYLLTFC